MTGVAKSWNSIPRPFALGQNFPNPFNPATRIRYSLPEARYVRLCIFDMPGRCIMTLVDGEMEAGYHEVSISSENLSSGMYFYRIETGSFTATRRMMVLK